MDCNLPAYSTETLEKLLAEKQAKPATPHLLEIIETIKKELQSRQENR